MAHITPCVAGSFCILINSMNAITKDELQQRLADAHISLRVRKSIRFVPSEIAHCSERDFLAVMDKARHDGVLLNDDFTAPFSLSARLPNTSGRIEAVICDICATWRRGTESAVITFKKGKNATVSHLVCADLDCSLHVRNMTNAATISRTQLREDIDSEQRVRRLRTRLKNIVSNL